MSAANPRYYKWYPTVSCDLGAMPFEGDWTLSDEIYTTAVNGTRNRYYYNELSAQFGRTVSKVIRPGVVRNVWEAGISAYPTTLSATGEPAPVWFKYCGDGVCVVKLPEGEQPEPVEP